MVFSYCHSSIGRQYLYYLLLSDKTSGMEKQEALQRKALVVTIDYIPIVLLKIGIQINSTK